MLISRRTLLAAGPAAIVGASSVAAQQATSEPAINFLVVGDWGKSDEPQQRAVAASMGKTARDFDSRFVVSTGDNFYERGVSSIADQLWESTYERVYSDEALLCPWFPVLGNHDHKGDAKAQIGYSSVSSRWTMPANYYRRTHTLGGLPLIELFFLDTTPLADDGSASWIRDALDGDSVTEQFQWLQSALGASRAKWKIVVGHHPVHSGGPHQISDKFVQRLSPLLSAYGVIAYMNGHDHNLQHIVADGLHYLTCGSGALSSAPSDASGSRFSSAETGSMRCELSSSHISIEYIAATGQSLYKSDLI